MTYVPNKWLTYILTISLFGNPWQNYNKQMRYERSHKSLNLYSLVECNKIYHNTNFWKTLREESLWQVDFDKLYFWNTLTKLIKASLFETKIIDCIQVIRTMCIKKEKKKKNTCKDKWKKHISTYKENKYNVCQ